MLPPDSLNMVVRLHEIIDEQHAWLSVSINDGAQNSFGIPGVFLAQL